MSPTNDASPEDLFTTVIRQSPLLRQFAAEREEILRHKWLESEKAHRDIGMQPAIINWILWHRQEWLQHRRREGQKQPAAVPPLATEPAKVRILVIDDDAGMVEILTIALQEAGYEVRSAGNGNEGLRLFRESTWNVVITDRAMPDMGGEQLAREIRAGSPGVSLVLITGLTAAVKSPDLFDAIVPKPFAVADLLKAVESLSRRPSA